MDNFNLYNNFKGSLQIVDNHKENTQELSKKSVSLQETGANKDKIYLLLNGRTTSSKFSPTICMSSIFPKPFKKAFRI